MALAIILLSFILVALLAYKGLICRRQRRKFIVSLKLHRQNGGLYTNCPDDTLPHEIDAVANYLARDGEASTSIPNGVGIHANKGNAKTYANGSIVMNPSNSTSAHVKSAPGSRLSPCPHCHLPTPSESDGFLDQSASTFAPAIDQSEAERLTLEREKGPSDTMDIQPPANKKGNNTQTVFADADDAVVAIKRALAHTGAIPKRRSSNRGGITEDSAPQLGVNISVNPNAKHHQQLVTNLAREQKMALDCGQCRGKAQNGVAGQTKDSMATMKPTTTTTRNSFGGVATETKIVTTKDKRGNSVVDSKVPQAKEDKPLVRIHSIRHKVERASMRKKAAV